jgi:hypothetical protein
LWNSQLTIRQPPPQQYANNDVPKLDQLLRTLGIKNCFNMSGKSSLSDFLRHSHNPLTYRPRSYLTALRRNTEPWSSRTDLTAKLQFPV